MNIEIFSGMRTLSVLVVLMDVCFKSFSQFLNPNDFDEQVTRRFDARVYDASGLFDSSEIQKRKIKSASLLLLYDGTTAADTLYIYYFDSTGKVTTQVSFAPPSSDTDGDYYVKENICNLNEPKITAAGDKYTVANYTLYGTERKTYRTSTDEMLDSEFIISRNCGDAYIQTNERSEIIAYPLEEGSTLIGRIVSIQINEGYYVTQYIIRYQYD